MVREIVKSAKQTYTLNIPDEMIGKTVEVIAFEINAEEQASVIKSSQDIQKKYSRYPLISHSNFSFNRDEANNYE